MNGGIRCGRCPGKVLIVGGVGDDGRCTGQCVNCSQEYDLRYRRGSWERWDPRSLLWQPLAGQGGVRPAATGAA